MVVVTSVNMKPSLHLPQQSARFTMVTSLTRTKFLNVTAHQGSFHLAVCVQLPWV